MNLMVYAQKIEKEAPKGFDQVRTGIARVRSVRDGGQTILNYLTHNMIL
ncbi:hypothetical protein [Arcicella rosea]|uniref:Uncharacterized protein n=1 Tax=Arcicella rosea TaxID=502909 RepID=A0A841EGY1_9BACT|nr:hypothetical protein [Arcicella rosea]MBB6002632.1 hypothetical protein [Arcicella rosea]